MLVQQWAIIWLTFLSKCALRMSWSGTWDDIKVEKCSTPQLCRDIHKLSGVDSLLVPDVKRIELWSRCHHQQINVIANWHSEGEKLDHTQNWQQYVMFHVVFRIWISSLTRCNDLWGVWASRLDKMYSRTCYEQLTLWHRKFGHLAQVAAHRRFLINEWPSDLP